ncbi:nucleotide disphospho-sugar-binding domain-containing protein [Actinokineospora enzanensis]|uniref:nucleotide disphospho-sugar-binding domain-containing protein n=1 Tax=Actinokineospora enzanensis TaxID=155975 RepID=UPI00035F0EEA|nr:nucleotide disphospho-sugar-binding domain-containing protein [Actinokineospora enzanensis]
MRVLLAVPPSPTRLRNLVPLAFALRVAGHDVKVAGRSAFVGDILDTGCVAVELEDGDAGSLSESTALVEFAELWRPDVVVADGQAAAGVQAARAVGAKSVRFLGASDVLGDNEFDADITLDTVPVSLRGGEGVRAVRHVPHFGPAEVPDWLRRKTRRARVLLSVGDPEPLTAAFAAIGEVPAEVVCAADPERLPDGITVPANVKIVDAAPPAALLPTCAAVVHDGDVALAHAAVSYGLPQLSLADNAFAARIAGSGAGFVGVEHMTELLGETVRDAAAVLRGEIEALPAPRAVVAELAR